MASKTNSCFLLLDVGGTFVKAGVASLSGELLPETNFSMSINSDGSREEIEGVLVEVVCRANRFAVAQGLAVAGIGVAIPGPFEYATGIARMTHKFQAINGVSLNDLLRSIPEIGQDLTIRFIHDVNAVLLGEMAHGNAANYRNVAVVTLGTGLGFACCLNGEVQYSPIGSPRISIYARPYRDGTLEDYVSKRGFLKCYTQLLGREPNPSLTVADLGRMAGEGDSQALKVFECVGHTLVTSLYDLLAEYNIECLLFGGQISRSFAYMEKTLHTGLEGLPCLQRIAPVAHINEAAFYGLMAELV